VFWVHSAQAQGNNVLSGQLTISCNTTATAVLPANAAKQLIYVRVPAGATNVVWFNFAGGTATAAPPNVDVSAGQAVSWSYPGVVPQGAVSCISTPALQAISVLYK